MDEGERPTGLGALNLSRPAPRRVRLHRAEGCRRHVLPLLGRLAHDRVMEDAEPSPQSSTRPRPWLN